MCDFGLEILSIAGAALVTAHGFMNLPAVVRHEFDVIEPILIQSSFSLPDAKSRINSSLLLVIQMLVNSAFLNEKYFQVKIRLAHCVRQPWQMPAKSGASWS